MVEISFYHLHSSPLEKALPKLMERVHQAGSCALILGKDEEAVELLNKTMWTYTTKYFLPHGCKQDKFSAEQPIYLTTDSDDNPNNATIATITDGRNIDTTADYAKPFDKILDMFDGTDETALQNARKRWKFYKEQDHTLTYWKQNAKGGWEKGA